MRIRLLFGAATLRRSIVDDAPAARSLDRDGGDQITAAWPHAADPDVLTRSDRGLQLARHVRLEMHFRTVDQEHSVGVAVRVEQEAIESPGDFGQVVGIEPMHFAAPLQREDRKARDRPKVATEPAVQVPCQAVEEDRDRTHAAATPRHGSVAPRTRRFAAGHP